MSKVLFVVAGILLALTVGLYAYLYFGRGDGLRSPEELSRDALESTNPEVRQRAALDLARTGEPGLAQMRRVLTQSKTPEVSAAVIEGLGAVRDFESMPLIIERLEDASEKVRANAGAAVADILGADFLFRPADPPEQRAQAIRAIKLAYEKMKKNPPPMYRKG